MFFCEKCNYTTEKHSSYSQHLKSGLHINGKRKERSDKQSFLCNICQYKTDSTKNLLSHQLNNHSTKEERQQKYSYYCEICDFGIFAKSLYEKHCQSKKHVSKINAKLERIDISMNPSTSDISLINTPFNPCFETTLAQQF